MWEDIKILNGHDSFVDFAHQNPVCRNGILLYQKDCYDIKKLL